MMKIIRPIQHRNLQQHCRFQCCCNIVETICAVWDAIQKLTVTLLQRYCNVTGILLKSYNITASFCTDCFINITATLPTLQQCYAACEIFSTSTVLAMEQFSLRTGKYSSCTPFLLRSLAISRRLSILLILVNLAISICCGGPKHVEENSSGENH